MESSKPKGYLLMHHISKNHNIGTIIRSASAFNFAKVFVIGKDQGQLKFKKVQKEFKLFGNQGTASQMEFQSFDKLQDAKKYFVENKITVCGVEITKDSQNVVTHPFKGDTVFLLGNEGDGILEVHKKICDQFVYIPQYTTKTASLNVACAASIIFHHFAIWAGYQESPIIGEKFQDQLALKNPEEDEGQKGEKSKAYTAAPQEPIQGLPKKEEEKLVVEDEDSDQNAGFSLFD